jgi:hypothetical protein
MLSVPGVVRTNEWYHLAAVSGRGGMKLLLDGAIIATNSYSGSFANTKAEAARLRLGRSVLDTEPKVDGQLAEARVWKVARTEVQIRQTIFTRLTGQEPGLAGNWNFADGTANDSSPGAHHGSLVGAAKIVMAPLPSRVEVAPWTRLTGKATDAAGTAIDRAVVRAEANGTELGRTTTNPSGDYILTVRTSAESLDLSATAQKDLIGSHTGIAISRYGQSGVDLVLRPALRIGGKVVALDGKTPHHQLVVELVRPAGAEIEPNGVRRGLRRANPRVSQRGIEFYGCIQQTVSSNFRHESSITLTKPPSKPG